MLLLAFFLPLFQQLDNGFLHPLGCVALGKILPQGVRGECHLVQIAFLLIAINEFLNATQLKADDVNVLFTLADLLTDQGDTNHAAEYYERISKLEPNNKEALRKLALFRESIGDYRAEVEYLEKLYDADKNDLNALKTLAKGYEKIKAKDKAIAAYNRFLELVKDPAEYKLVKDKLDKLDSTQMEESEGLIDKLVRLFSRK